MVRIFEAQELDVMSESQDGDDDDDDDADMMNDRAHLSTQNQAIRCHSDAANAGVWAMARKDPR